MKDLPSLEFFSSKEKDAPSRELWQMVQALQAEVGKLKRISDTLLSRMYYSLIDTFLYSL